MRRQSDSSMKNILKWSHCSRKCYWVDWRRRLITPDLVRKLAIDTKGSGGRFHSNADDWRRMIGTKLYGAESTDLCNSIVRFNVNNENSLYSWVRNRRGSPAINFSDFDANMKNQNWLSWTKLNFIFFWRTHNTKTSNLRPFKLKNVC